MTVDSGVQSPASKLMDEAIERAIEEKPIVPERSSFIDADTPHTERRIMQAAERGYAAVVVYADGSKRVISPDEALGRAGQTPSGA
jgi:hypothetical protein